jgi:hypothetical protein
LGDEKSGVGVSEVMESNRLRETGASQGWLEVPAVEVVVAQRAALWTGEDELGYATPTRPQMRGEVLSQESRQWHPTPVIVLRRAEHEPAIDLRCRLGHFQGRTKEVELSDTKGDHFACPQPRIGAQPEQQAELRQVCSPVSRSAVPGGFDCRMSDGLGEVFNLLRDGLGPVAADVRCQYGWGVMFFPLA